MVVARGRGSQAALLAGLVVVGALLTACTPEGTSRSAGECEWVSSAKCAPFLAALHREIDSNGRAVRSIDGRPWCGEAACQTVFGARLTRLRVTYRDRGREDYLCSAGPLDETATCELAESSD